MTREYDRSYVDVVTDLLTQGHYSMAFQPIVETESGDIFGFEALLRGPQGTPLENPDRFFNRKDHDTDAFLSHVDMACIWSAVRSGTVLPSYARLFINIHGNTVPQFSQGINAFIEYIKELNISPERIIFEISERTCTIENTSFTQNLHRLRSSGFSLAIDDVDFNYPPYNYIEWLEHGYLKLDRSFGYWIHDHAKKKEIVSGIAKIVGAMDIRLVAKEIESEKEFSLIGELDVPLAQGFFIGRPLPADVWTGYVKENNGRTLPLHDEQTYARASDGKR
jgi:EAL domain-containing protein (putative c-di-GMP-specific phosphodiesterase class I)